MNCYTTLLTRDILPILLERYFEDIYSRVKCEIFFLYWFPIDRPVHFIIGYIGTKPECDLLKTFDFQWISFVDRASERTRDGEKG